MASTQTHSGMAVHYHGLPLLRALAENWWLLLLRGIAAIAFGIMSFIWPGLTLLTLVFLWGSYALVDGAFALWAGISGRADAHVSRWWLTLVGIVGIIAGLLAFGWPGVTAQMLLVFIAVWAMIVGLLQIVGAIELRKEIRGEWLLVLSGVLSIALGVAMIARPAAGAVAIVWLIGYFALLVGCIYIALSFELRRHRHPA
jgi:uncharacterized membrane protein HdeD (DUF308 family)